MDELSDAKIRNAAATNKEYAIADGQGLSIVVRPNGTKLWLYRYRFGGKRKNMSFGTFPGVGLKAARKKRHNAEKAARSGCQDQSRARGQATGRQKLKHTFRAVTDTMMREPRDFDGELKALGDKARDLESRKVQQLGELVFATEADTLTAEE
ncbi:MAG: DUF4102 domain-containing protein, partial [Bradyrhizobium sp.]|nr:DUF4102 domain-containing protein [Bradyrhizobium sp.]